MANAICRIRFRLALDGRAISMVGELDGKDLDRDHHRQLQSERQPKPIGEPIIEQQLTAKAGDRSSTRRSVRLWDGSRPDARTPALCLNRTIKSGRPGTENVGNGLQALVAGDVRGGFPVNAGVLLRRYAMRPRRSPNRPSWCWSSTTTRR